MVRAVAAVRALALLACCALGLPALAQTQSAAPPAARPAAPASTARPACAKPVYPREALRYELEGNTVLEYAMDAEGHVLAPSVKKSSGWALLDDAAIQTLMSCTFTPALVAHYGTRRLPVQYNWTLDTQSVRAALVPGSCAPSARFERFVAMDKTPSGPDGVLARLLLRADGSPYGVRFEGSDLSFDQQAEAQRYLESCRFAYDAATAGKRTDTLFGRLVFK